MSQLSDIIQDKTTLLMLGNVRPIIFKLLFIQQNLLKLYILLYSRLFFKCSILVAGLIQTLYTTVLLLLVVFSNIGYKNGTNIGITIGTIRSTAHA